MVRGKAEIAQGQSYVTDEEAARMVVTGQQCGGEREGGSKEREGLLPPSLPAAISYALTVYPTNPTAVLRSTHHRLSEARAP